MHSGDVTLLEREQVPATARLLARALSDDPAYAVIFPDEATRRAGLELFFTRHLATHVPHRCSYVDRADDGAVQASVTVRPPGGIRVSTAALLPGLLRLAVSYGAGAIRRLLAVKDVYDALEREAAAGRPYWHVHMMGVLPELQGKGVGGALLAAALAPCARVAAPIVLTTHKAINVRFYRRAGFELTREQTVSPAGAAPYTVWCMRRDA